VAAISVAIAPTRRILADALVRSDVTLRRQVRLGVAEVLTVDMLISFCEAVRCVVNRPRRGIVGGE
jgi:hypothetical protein